MRKKIIYITIESVKRELDSKILLALKALKKNFRVVIGQKGELREFIKDANPGIMILKSFGPKNTKHIDYIKKNKFKIISSDEELITALDYEDKIEDRLNNENLNKLDLYLAVGETSDLPIFKQKFKSMIDKILLCGNIRLELLKKKYRKILDKDTLLNKQKYGDFILLLTGFAHINKIRRNSEIDYIFNRIVNDNYNPDSNHIYLINEAVKMQREILMQTLKFVNSFEKNFPKKNLVISVHPNEKIDFWKNYVNKRKFKNVYLNTNLHTSSNSLINASKVLVSSNSTSLLEAFFLEKKTINLLGKKERISEISLLKKISQVVRSSNELNETIKDIEKNDNFAFKNKKITEIRNSDENFDSFEKILNNLDSLDNVNKFNCIFKNKFYFIISQLRTLKNYLRWVISVFINKNGIHHRLHQEKVGKRLKKFFFIKNVKHINEYENIKNLVIKKVSREVFLLDIYKKE